MTETSKHQKTTTIEGGGCFSSLKTRDPSWDLSSDDASDDGSRHKSTNGLTQKSGLTIGLILKEYGEFHGMSLMFFNVGMLILGIYFIYLQENSAQQPNFTFRSMQSLTTNHDKQRDLYSYDSLPKAAEFTCSQLEDMVSNSIAHGLRPQGSDIQAGSFGDLIAVQFAVGLPASESLADNLRLPKLPCPLSPSASGASAVDPTGMCAAATSVLYPTASTPFLAPFAPSPTKYHNKQASTRIATVFDSRQAEWTQQQSLAAVTYLCDTAVPALAPFAQEVTLYALFQDITEGTSMTVVEIMSALTHGQSIDPLGSKSQVRVRVRV